MTDVKQLYETDTLAWSKHQADALRAAAQGDSNQPLDWENLAEEIEDLGRSQRRELASRIATIIEHLAKLAQSPAAEPRAGWRQTIRRERLEIERLIEDSPSLDREITHLLEKTKKGAVALAIDELEARNELSAALREALQSQSAVELFPYQREQILGDWFPPVPPADR